MQTFDALVIGGSLNLLNDMMIKMSVVDHVYYINSYLHEIVCAGCSGMNASEWGNKYSNAINRAVIAKEKSSVHDIMTILREGQILASASVSQVNRYCTVAINVWRFSNTKKFKDYLIPCLEPFSLNFLLHKTIWKGEDMWEQCFIFRCMAFWYAGSKLEDTIHVDGYLHAEKEALGWNRSISSNKMESKWKQSSECVHKIVTFIKALWVKLDSRLTATGDDSVLTRTSWMSRLLGKRNLGSVWGQEYSKMLNFIHRAQTTVPFDSILAMNLNENHGRGSLLLYMADLIDEYEEKSDSDSSPTEKVDEIESDSEETIESIEEEMKSAPDNEGIANINDVDEVKMNNEGTGKPELNAEHMIILDKSLVETNKNESKGGNSQCHSFSCKKRKESDVQKTSLYPKRNRRKIRKIPNSPSSGIESSEESVEEENNPASTTSSALTNDMLRKAEEILRYSFTGEMNKWDKRSAEVQEEEDEYGFRVTHRTENFLAWNPPCLRMGGFDNVVQEGYSDFGPKKVDDFGTWYKGTVAPIGTRNLLVTRLNEDKTRRFTTLFPSFKVDCTMKSAKDETKIPRVIPSYYWDQCCMKSNSKFRIQAILRALGSLPPHRSLFVNISVEDFLAIRTNLVCAVTAHNAALRSYFGEPQSQRAECSRQESEALCIQSCCLQNSKFELYRQRVNSIGFVIIEDFSE